MDTTNQKVEAGTQVTNGKQDILEAVKSQQPPNYFQRLKRKFRGLDVINATNEGKLKWELEKHLSLYKDYCDLGVKGVGIFAATVGGILSISFAVGSDLTVKVFLLQSAFIMSIVMGIIFITCSFLWFRVSTKTKWIARKLGMVKFPDIVYLSILLLIFGVLFFVVAGRLDSLKSQVISLSPPIKSVDPPIR